MSYKAKRYIFLSIISGTLIIIFGIILRASQDSKSNGERFNIVLILCDALRADHLGVYGYERSLTPNLDRFAAESIVFMDAISAAPWTPPSIASLFTGVNPSSHSFNPPNNRDLARRRSLRLASTWTTLAEIMASHGYNTASVSASPWISDDFGLAQGFLHYYMKAGMNAEMINRQISELLDQLRYEKKPLFLYLHYMDVHEHPSRKGKKNLSPIPKLKRWDYSEEMLARIGFYDDRLAYFDWQFGELLQLLKSNRLYDHTIIFFLADHGEQFKERGRLGHGYNLFDEELHVPLIIKDNTKPKKVAGTVTNMDLFATILDYAGIELPEGRNALSLRDSSAISQRAGILSEGTRKKKRYSYTSFQGKKIIMEEVKKNNKTSLQSMGVFDRVADRKEISLIKDPRLTEELRESLLQSIKLAKSRSKKPETVEISPESLNSLRTLGYLN